MTENQDENNIGETCEEEEDFSEPLSLADHQILMHSARKIVNKARKFARQTNQNKKPKVFNKNEDGREIVLMPRQEGKWIKVIKLPVRIEPKTTLTVRKNSQPCTSKLSDPLSQATKDPVTSPDPLSEDQNQISKSQSGPTPSLVPTKMAGQPGQTVSLTIGDRKIFVRPIVQQKSPLKFSGEASKPHQKVLIRATNLKSNEEMSGAAKPSDESNEEQKEAETVTKPDEQKNVSTSDGEAKAPENALNQLKVKKPAQAVFIRPAFKRVIPPKLEDALKSKILFKPKVLQPKSLVSKTFLNNANTKLKVIARGKMMNKKRDNSSDEEVEIEQGPPKDLNPEDFPKAIVYPDAPKEKPPMKITNVVSKSPFTFNHVFEEVAMQPPKPINDGIAANLKPRVQPIERSTSSDNESGNKKSKRKQELRTIEIPEEDESQGSHKESSPVDDELDEQFVAVVEGKRKPNFTTITKSQSDSSSSSATQSGSEADKNPDGDTEEQFIALIECDETLNDEEIEKIQVLKSVEAPSTSQPLRVYPQAKTSHMVMPAGSSLLKTSFTTPRFRGNVFQQGMKNQTESFKGRILSPATLMMRRPVNPMNLRMPNVSVKTPLRMVNPARPQAPSTKIINPFHSTPHVRAPYVHLQQQQQQAHQIQQAHKVHQMQQARQVHQIQQQQQANQVQKVHQIQQAPKIILPILDSPIEIDDDESDEDQFEAVRVDSSPQQICPELGFDMPQRPKSNIELMNILSSYRVIARYLMLKNKVPPFNFDSVDTEYINVYKTLKK